MRYLWFVVALTACVDPTGAGNGPNAVRLYSDPGDSVGGGKTYAYTQANAILGVDWSGIPPTLTVGVSGDEQWIGQFSMPTGVTRIEPGTYDSTFFTWHGGGPGYYGCSTVTGSFKIDRVSYDSTRVSAVDLSFEQHCNGAAGALHGTIHWRTGDPTEPPGPVNPPPTNLWRPPSGATPAGVNFVYLESDSGDYVGQGQTHLDTLPADTIRVTASGPSLHVGVTGGETWSGEFRAMTSLRRLAVGYYPGLLGYYWSPNLTKGALDWSAPGRFCVLLNGWFAIDRVTYSADTITAIDLRFEQRCQGAPGALHGAVHWSS